MIAECLYMGAKAFSIGNDRFSAVFLPEFGGKMVSLYDKRRDFEFLFQNPYGNFRKAVRGASFMDFEACGFDDAFPNIDPETVEFDGRLIDYPDHGEIWSASFDSEILDRETLSFTWDSPLRYRYRKTFSVTRTVYAAIGSFVIPVSIRCRVSGRFIFSRRTVNRCVWFSLRQRGRSEMS